MSFHFHHNSLKWACYDLHYGTPEECNLNDLLQLTSLPTSWAGRELEPTWIGWQSWLCTSPSQLCIQVSQVGSLNQLQWKYYTIEIFKCYKPETFLENPLLSNLLVFLWMESGFYSKHTKPKSFSVTVNNFFLYLDWLFIFYNFGAYFKLSYIWKHKGQPHFLCVSLEVGWL